MKIQRLTTENRPRVYALLRGLSFSLTRIRTKNLLPPLCLSLIPSF